MKALAISSTENWIMSATWPRWVWMWLLAFAIFVACKLFTWFAAAIQDVPVWRQLAYLFTWPGLDADRFLDEQCRPLAPNAGEWFSGAAQFMLGASVFWNAQWLLYAASPTLLGWTGMVGVVLMLHFGVFKLLSCAWRAIGVDARPLMVAPLLATSVAEFWSKRWNTAFRDFTHQFLFRPLTRRCGVRTALLLSFLFSGLIHDAVLSIPAGGGYGGPTAYFVIQALAMTIEKSRSGLRLGLGSGWRGWLFTAIVLLAPVRLLFHDPFVTAVVAPFMRALGAA